MISIEVNNRTIEAQEGETLLSALKRANITVPTLCHMELHNMNIENKTININRGDSGNILLKVPISSTEFYQFITGDKIQFRIFNKGDYSTPIKTKDRTT